MTVEKVVAVFTSRDPALSEPGYAAAARSPTRRGSTSCSRGTSSPGTSCGTGSESPSRRARSERADREPPRLPPPADALAPHGRPRRRRAGPRASRGGLPRPRLLGRALRRPVSQPPASRGSPGRCSATATGGCDEARWAAREAGYDGAMFPWQSGSDGREETQRRHLNPRSGRWIPDSSSLQRHVNAAIVYNVWQYYQVTGDLDFLRGFGAELIIEIARFWSSIARYNRALDRYEICGVMGPDEYHDAYPGRIRRPASTTTPTRTSWRSGCSAGRSTCSTLLPSDRSASCEQRLAITLRRSSAGRTSAARCASCFHEDGILSQFEGYEQLEELDWDALPLALRRHQSPRPDPRDRGRHSEPLQGARSRPTC